MHQFIELEVGKELTQPGYFGSLGEGAIAENATANGTLSAR